MAKRNAAFREHGPGVIQINTSLPSETPYWELAKADTYITFEEALGPLATLKARYPHTDYRIVKA